ncbi:TolC family protein [Novosphingobium percolationis]|uniref:TolC family protein n=1 Tax=Novosphingobium percolationis TaxID=2871811 RepID=UPI001CD374CC|nr:TolC family protein [Novosphingobium percolationis]
MRDRLTVDIAAEMIVAAPLTCGFKLRLAVPLLFLAATSGCVSYRPHPVSPDAIAAARDARTLDQAEVEHRVAEIAPVRPASPVIWDRLSLFAATTLYNADVAAARAAVDTAAANVGVARQWPNMTLTLTSEYARDPSASSPWLFGGALDIPLDIGGRRTTRIGTADLAVLSARYDVAEAIWSARIALRRALAQRMVADRQIAALGALAQVRDRQFAAMARRVAAGEASRAELERVRADGADAGRRLVDAQAQHRAADRAIAAAVGVPETAVRPLAMAWDGFDEPAPDPGSQVTTELRLEAVRSRADVLKAIVAYDQAESDLRGEVAKQFPAISVAPGYTWERGLVKVPFSLGLILPPLDLNRHAIAAAEARRAEAGKRLEAVIASAEAAIDAALVETRAARAALERIRTVERVAAGRLAVQADRELAAGAIDRTDWAAAQAGAEQARTSEIDALARVHVADAALEDALRRPLEGPETMITTGRTGEQRR